MKKKILLSLLIGIMCCTSTVFAEEETEAQEFTFRGIPWYSTKADVEKIFTDAGATIENAAFDNYVLRMSGIDYINTMSGSDYVEDGGATGRYSGLDVAGYQPSDTKACYIYSLNEDGTINKSIDDAEFYFGWYTFDSNDYVDGEGIYNDLSEKLTSLYGSGTEDTSDDYHDTITWYDASNNQIRLLLGGKSKDYKFVTLGYIAADADARLDEMQAALDAEAAANEAAEREANKADTSGL